MGARLALVMAAAAAVALGGCGGGAGARLPVSVLGLPTAPAPHQLGATTLATSPDGGIYRNPDPTQVILVGGVSGHAVAERLGGAAAEWDQLGRLGDFAVVGLRLHNAGKAGSDPELDDLQVASDFAPAAADAGPLRHFYHPTFPLAALGTAPINGQCGVHLDPGESALVLLVYPPLRPATSIVWGRYQDFALTLPRGGAVPGDAGDLFSARCSPPQPPPA
jgi:hypothetical protein